MTEEKIRKNHSCKNYTIYNGAGFFVCELCGKEIHFTKLNLRLKHLVQYYDDENEMLEYVIIKP